MSRYPRTICSSLQSALSVNRIVLPNSVRRKASKADASVRTLQRADRCLSHRFGQ